MIVALALASGLSLVVQAATAPPLPLAQAVALARTQSPLRGGAHELALGTAEAERFSGRLPNPFVDIRIENLGTSHDQLPYDIFAIANQAIELGGKRGLRRGLAAAERDIASAGLVLTDRQIELRTVALYVQALRARGEASALRVNRDGLTTLIDTTRARVREGFSSEASLLRFETEAARLEIDMARAELDLGRTLAALAFVIGLATPIAPDSLFEPLPVAAPSADAVVADSHPELVVAAARERRAQQAAALERARRLPDPILNAGYKRTSGFDTGSLGVTMTLPLFETNSSAAARAAGEMRAAAAEARAITARLASERTALIASARTLAVRAADAPARLTQPAEAVRNAARAEFREGVADALKLIDAERIYADVQRVALDLRLEALVAAIEARLALGLEMLP